MKIILGPPGTGKTTTLLNIMQKQLSAGIQPEKIGFVSFSKKAVVEATDRAAIKFKIPKKRFTYFRTLHSFCFYTMGFKRHQTVGWEQLKDFSRLIGLTLSGSFNEDTLMRENNRGDQLLMLHNLALNKRISLEDVIQESEHFHFNIQELEHFTETYTRWKQANSLIDYTDQLTTFLEKGSPPKLEYLFVDEAQDLCRLQWLIVDKIRKNVSRETYIAGDDDQAIHRWNGADVDYLISLAEDKAHHTTVLEKSYRLPPEIHQVACSLQKEIQGYPKKFMPRKGVGKVENLLEIWDIDKEMEKGEWLILVRNTFLAKDIIEFVRQKGFCYESPFTPQQNSSLKALKAWSELRKGHAITVPQVKILVSYISSKDYDPIRLKGLSETRAKFNIEALKQAVKLNMDFDRPWSETLYRMGTDDLNYYEAATQMGENLFGKPRIYIGTIHSAKGGECDNVVLFTGMSNRTFDSFNKSPHWRDEYRVFYVGVTRAKQNLYIVPSHETQNQFEIGVLSNEPEKISG